MEKGRGKFEKGRWGFKGQTQEMSRTKVVILSDPVTKGFVFSKILLKTGFREFDC